MTQEQINKRDLMTQIFHLLYELNTKGYYTAWFEHCGHTEQIVIKIIKGKWREGKPQKEVCNYLISTHRSQWTDGLSLTPFDTGAFFRLLDELIAYKPKRRKKCA